MTNEHDMTAAVKSAALAEGFVAVGIAPAAAPPHGDRLRDWLARGWHAEMGYMERNLPKRLGAVPLVESARSVICLAAAIAPPLGSDGTARVARYAHGRDYHKVLKRKCVRLMDRVRGLAPGFEGRAFVDSAPVMERSLAAWSGVGWIGRNGCLYVPGWGSHVLLCEVFCNLPLAADAPIPSPCGDCGKCAEACPTGAIGRDGLVDARKCISYLTIECRGEIAPALWPLMGGCVFGCDRCQDACPHNRSENRDTTLFPAGNRVASLFSATLAAVVNWERDDWDAATRGSACRRATWEMVLRNVAIAAGNSGDASLGAPLESLRRRVPELGDVVAWALGRLGDTHQP
jgi:epoxyqueuosine reductase